MEMMLLLAAFQEEESGRGAGIVGALFGGAFFLVWLAVLVLVFVSLWKIFEKAGKPGWAGIVPIYNLIVLLEIVGKPLWWIVLFFLPCVNIVGWVLVTVELAKSFGKDVGYAVGMILLPFIFYPMLAFSDARYQAPAGAPAARV